MFRNFLKDYFSFTKKERNAVIILIVLLTVFFGLPSVMPLSHRDVAIKADSILLHAVAHVSALPETRYYKRKYTAYDHPYRYSERYSAREGRTRYYSGYSGRHDSGYYKRSISSGGYSSNKTFYRARNVPLVSAILINEADSIGLLPLPGIGNKLAARIIAFRNKLGGFYSIDQVAETYGLPDSTFQLIREKLTLGQSTVTTININTADAEQLKQHPYVRWNLANAITQYRKQHGNFKELQELLQIALITPDLYNKMSHYLTVGDRNTEE